MQIHNQKVVFGMNSLFAVRHLLPETLASVRRRGFDAIVVAPPSDDPGGRPADLSPGVEFRPIAVEREISPLADLRALWRLYKILHCIRPAITDMSTPKMALLGGLAAILTGVPHRIYTLRGLRYETTRSWKRLLLMACEKLACACAHQVICISRSVRDAALRDRIAPAEKLALLGDRASEGIPLLPHGEPDSTLAGEIRERLGVPKQSMVIGFVGRLTRDKGLHELAACFQILRREGLPVLLLLLGDFEPGDPVDPDVAKWIRTDPDVRWLGYVAHPQPYYEVMDVFVFPTHREGLGKVLLEAASAGKPVVSTRTTGVVDVVLEDVTGLLVPSGDAPALARATGRLLRDPELAARMGNAARRLVHEHFDNSVYLERFGMILESLSRGQPIPVFHRQ